jgi:uncharacterized protein YaiE (UPF0345 family)
VGTTVHDTATLSGGNNPTGSIVFTLFPDTASCNAGTGAVFTSTNALSTSAPFQATSGSLTTTAIGAYEWRASYAGDSNNNGVMSACGSEPVTITKVVPHITTTASAGGPVGTVVSDLATITGGMNPTGTVTFKLYSSLADCTAGSSPVFTALNQPLSTTPPLTATSGSFTPTSPGHYNWVAHYNGDAVNMIMETKCGDEPLDITTAAPSITTSASAGGQVPVTVHDTATVSGGASPTGTVTFTLYADLASCNAGTGPLFTSAAIALSGGMATSGTFSLTTAGTFQWKASYSGDANNAPVSSTCGDEPVVTTKGGGGVLGITTPGTGSSEALSGLTLGGFLALAGLGLALAGAIVPRRNRI